MATSTLPMSELDAINIMLSSIGEAPVNSIDTSGIGDVAVAKAILNESNRSVQEKGWGFNQERRYKLVRDVDNTIPVPVSALRVSASDMEFGNYTVRAGKLYDRDNHTYSFTKDMEVDIVFLLPYDDIPQAAKYYIAILATRIFQRRVLGAEYLERYTQEEELRALTSLIDAECETVDYNMITDNYDSLSIISRVPSGSYIL
jgi:hypothetical protein